MYSIPSKNYLSTDRIDFGFVLLPDLAQVNELLAFRDGVREKLLSLRSSANVPVTLPHISVGHYALLAAEIPTLKMLLDKVVVEFSEIIEEMRAHLHVSKYNISLECVNLRDRTNPQIVKMYKCLRKTFLEDVITKQPTIRAYHHKLIFKDQPMELELIDNFYQNWNTPELNKIRPHLTLIYSHAGKELVSSAIDEITVPASLKTIKFSYLGVVAIDLNGNPLSDGLIHIAALMQ
jgi:hypothetical protein